MGTKTVKLGLGHYTMLKELQVKILKTKKISVSQKNLIEYLIKKALIETTN